MARKIDSFYPKDFPVLEEPCLISWNIPAGLAATSLLPERNIFGPGEITDLIDLRVFLDFKPETD
jgi:hypothetical protein